MYEYKAKVVGVYDGDTITVNISLGFGIVLHDQRLRLYGINAPEMRGPEKEQGKVSRDWLREGILGKDITLRTRKTKRGEDKKGKYGRWLATIIVDGSNINKMSVAFGHSERKEY